MTAHNWVERPLCPFCREPWTDSMMDQYDEMTGSPSCACCASMPVVVHWPIPKPASDLCCAACGEAIYRAP